MTMVITLTQRRTTIWEVKQNQRQQLIDNWQPPHRQQQPHFAHFLVSFEKKRLL